MRLLLALTVAGVGVLGFVIGTADGRLYLAAAGVAATWAALWVACR